MAFDNEGIKSRQLCKNAGITYRQADMWTKLGYLKCSVRAASGSGNAPRLYSALDVEVARVLGVLGLSQTAEPQRRAISECLYERLPEVEGECCVLIGSSVRLVTSAVTVLDKLDEATCIVRTHGFATVNEAISA